MRQVLFTHGPTLHAKVTIPLAIRFASDGWDVAYVVNRPTFMGISYGFSDDYIRSNPTRVMIRNPQSLRFVARLIGYENDWHAVERRIRYVRRGHFEGFDAVVGTLADRDRMKDIRGRSNVPLFALGYAHTPFLMKIGEPFRSKDDTSYAESVFLTDNAFARTHGFQEILKGSGLLACGFMYLDKVWQYLTQEAGPTSENCWVLIFHPGGYRGELTQPGDSKSVCYARQKSFVERFCLPLISAGFKPVIKIHPLRARFHDLEDVTEIVGHVERENSLDEGSIACLGPESWYWEYAVKSSLILTVGSSSVYELWSAGLRNVVICDFEGGTRTRQYRAFECIVVDSYQQYLDLIASESFRDIEFDPLTARVFEGYHSLFDGQSTQIAYEAITEEISARALV